MIRAGHRIALLSRDARVHWALHAAAWTQRFTMVPLPMRDPPTAWQAGLEHADVLMADAMHADSARAIHGAIPTLIVDEEARPIDHLEGTLAEPGTDLEVHGLVRTTGTSGAPSWVPVRRPQLVAHRRAAMRRLACGPDSVWLASLPMWHIGGIALLDRCLHDGGQPMFQTDGALDETARALQTGTVTHVSLVPTQLHRLLEMGVTPDGLEVALVGGGPMHAGLVERALAAGWPVHATYGLTEACSQVATATPDELVDDPGTCGRPLDGVTIEIESFADAHEDGQIVVQGETVLNGRHVTGDIGRMVDGRLYVSGRIDDRIISGGENLDVVRIESLASTWDGVDEIAWVGIDDPEWGQRAIAFYAGTASEAALQERARKELAGHERPKAWHHVDALPRVGEKVSRHTLRQWAHESAHGTAV